VAGSAPLPACRRLTGGMGQRRRKAGEALWPAGTGSSGGGGPRWDQVGSWPWAMADPTVLVAQHIGDLAGEVSLRCRAW